MSQYKAKGEYNDRALSKSDFEQIQKLKQLYNQAQARGDEEAAKQAHEAAERVRELYGYSGGEDGSEYVKLNNTAADLTALLTQLNESKTQAKISALECEYEKQISSLKNADKVDYDAMRNRAVAESEQQSRSFAEKAAAAGLNSGAAAQSELARSLALQRELGEISAAEAEDLSALSNSIATLEAERAREISAAVSEGEYELADDLYAQALRERDEQQEALEKQSKAETEKAQQQLKLAQLAAKYGDLSLLRALGIDAKESTSSKSSSSKSSTSKSTSAKSENNSQNTPEELFELMFENEPNEYIYLTINRDKWNIPANELEDVWKEYYIWRGKHINETMSMAPAIAGSAMAERSN